MDTLLEYGYSIPLSSFMEEILQMLLAYSLMDAPETLIF